MHTVFLSALYPYYPYMYFDSAYPESLYAAPAAPPPPAQEAPPTGTGNLQEPDVVRTSFDEVWLWSDEVTE